MRKKFDLQYYLEHPETKVVTRDGRNARILCTDLDGNNGYCVAAALSEHGCTENLSSFTKEGRFWSNLSESNNDLFFDLPDPVKRVPLTYKDLLERVKAGKTMWIESTFGLVLVTFIDDEGNMVYGDTAMTPQKLMDEELHFADGTPCWKEVEDEEKKNERHGGHPWPECQKFCRHYVAGKESMFCHDCSGSDDWFEAKGGDE